MTEKRDKPKFFRRDSHKRISLGKSIKKLRKWRAAKGRHNKIRLKRKGHAQKPTIGWGSDKSIRGKINGKEYVSVNNVGGLEGIKKGGVILVGKVGMRKRQEIIKKANEVGLIILNKYRKQKNEA